MQSPGILDRTRRRNDHGYIRMEEPEHFTVGRPPDTRIFVNPDQKYKDPLNNLAIFYRECQESEEEPEE